jgi:hypothetical protein
MLSTCSPETACGILADEAFADLLQKHGRPVDLKTLRQSVDEIGPPAPSRWPTIFCRLKQSGGCGRSFGRSTPT